MEGLDSCKNPFDLVENFPLTGIQVKINKSLIVKSVWQCQIQDVLFLKQYTDMTAVIKNSGAVILKEGDKSYSVNFFLPILNQCDQKLVPLLKTSIFNIIFTYNLLNDAD